MKARDDAVFETLQAIPPPLSSYLHAVNSGDLVSALTHVSPRVVIVLEQDGTREMMRGHAGIDDWLRMMMQAGTVTIAPLEATRIGDDTRVLLSVSIYRPDFGVARGLQEVDYRITDDLITHITARALQRLKFLRDEEASH